MFSELHTASAFSFLDGASLPATLVERAASLGYSTLALLDRDGVYGAPQFYRAARSAGLKAIVGAELTIQSVSPRSPDGSMARWPDDPIARSPDRSMARWPDGPIADRPWLLPVLVSSREGYRNLCRLITRAKLRSPKGEASLVLDEFAGQTTGLIALVGREALRSDRHGVGGLAESILRVFDRTQVWVELQRHYRRDDARAVSSLLDLAAAFRLPVMASNGVRFATPEDRPLYDVLTCIRHKTTIEAAGRRLTANAERYLKSPEAMTRLFADLPQALAGTEALAERLEFTLADLGYRFPDYPVPAGESQVSFLRRITQVGARDRYRPYHDRARAQIQRELDLIDRLDLAGYFLIVWDIVNFCRQQGILVQGRGSAANSAVCYALGITAVDPVGMELLFERFLSEERGEWPDIDLDLPSGDRRERVIQYVYERYGARGAAMTANVITYRGRSAAREVGKVLGLPESEIDRLARLMSQFEFVDPEETLAQNLRESGLDPADRRYQTFGRLWTAIQDLPRHLGQHSGGMVVCQGRLDEIVPLENASMPGRVVVQWDKDDCADLGLIKIDLLGLGMMAALEDAIAIVNTPDFKLQTSDFKLLTSNFKLDLARLPPDDPAVYRLLQTADTVGVFQVESRAQMATLPRLRPERFYDIVVEVAIIRPGPIVGDMVHPYLARRRGEQPVSYPHPLLEPVLKRTLGVPLFQEQLLRMAMVVAGFSGGEAEELRRAMGFKRSVKRMQAIETRLRDGMTRNGITGEAADRIVQSITSFALYGFPESHAASFALIVYASAYLKAHYPAAFYTALLNNQPMGFYSPATLVKDAQRRGVRFTPIDVQVSGWNCRVEPDGSIRLGLRYVQGLREAAGRRIERCHVGSVKPEVGSQERTDAGPLRHSRDSRRGEPFAVRGRWRGEPSGSPDHVKDGTRQQVPDFRLLASHFSLDRYHSLDALVADAGLRQDELRVLAEVGALASFGRDRRTALWQAERAGRPAGPLLGDEERGSSQKAEVRSLKSGGPNDSLTVGGPNLEVRPDRRAASAPAADSPLEPMTLAERVQADYDGTGLTIGPHPMAIVRPVLAARGVARAIDLRHTRAGRRVRVAGAVITRQRPGTAKGFVFLSLEDETGIANIIVTPPVFAEFKRTIVDAPYLLVEGPLQNQSGAISVKAERVEALATDGPELASHDFH